jgi:hypothetical protein
MTYVHGALRCNACLRDRNVKGRPGQTVRFTYTCECGSRIDMQHTFASVN